MSAYVTVGRIPEGFEINDELVNKVLDEIKKGSLSEDKLPETSEIRDTIKNFIDWPAFDFHSTHLIEGNVAWTMIDILSEKDCIIGGGDIADWNNVFVNLTVMEKEDNGQTSDSKEI